MAGGPNGPLPASFLQDTAPRPISAPTPKAAFFRPGMTATHSAFFRRSVGISESGAFTSSSTTFEDSQSRSAILSSASNIERTMKSIRIVVSLSNGQETQRHGDTKGARAIGEQTSKFVF